MDRQQAEKLLAALIFDDLDEASKAELLAYLETDDELRERLADMCMATKLACDAVNDGPDPVLSDHRLRKLERLARIERPRMRVILRRRLTAAAAVLAFSVVLAGLLIPCLSKWKHASSREAAVLADVRMQRRLAQLSASRTDRAAEGLESESEAMPDFRRDRGDMVGIDGYGAGTNGQGMMGGMGGMSGYAGGTDGYGMGGMGGYGMGGYAGGANGRGMMGGGMGGYGMGAEANGTVAHAFTTEDSIRLSGGTSLGIGSDMLGSGNLRVARDVAPFSAVTVTDSRRVQAEALEESRQASAEEFQRGLVARGSERTSGSAPTPPVRRPAARVTNGTVADSVTGPSGGPQQESQERPMTSGGGVYGGAVAYGWSGTVTPTRPSGVVLDTESPSGARARGKASASATGQTDLGRTWYYRPQDGSEPTSSTDSLEMVRKTKSDETLIAGAGEAVSRESVDQPALNVSTPALAVQTDGKSVADLDADVAAKVPVLGDLPITGGLLKTKGEPPTSQPVNELGSESLLGWESAGERSNRVADPNLGESAVRLHEKLSEDLSDLPSESRFRVVPVNPWVMTERDAQSTFALDVDTASYALCRRYIRSGYLPPIGAVRMEEFVNAFDYAYPQRDQPTFAVYAEGAPSPFAPPGQDLTLLKLAVKARTVGRDQRRPAHLVLVVDASASMDQPDRLAEVQSTLDLLVDKLSEADRVSLITCAEEARLHLEAIPTRQKDTIRQTIDAIQPAGPTNLLAGLELGYATARRAFVAGQINQVVLCSDGVANVGQIEADAVIAEVADDRKQGITLICVGVGYGAYNDAFLETLADHGDGRYVFLDSGSEARQALVTHLSDTLQTVAKDARIQVEFNPDRVRRYRLIGYENRDIEDERFRDDTIDAGEVGSGQCVTALYELELTAPHDTPDSAIGTVFVRYRDLETDIIEEVVRPLSTSVIKRRSVEEDPRFFLAAGAARFAEWLRQSEHAQHTALPNVQRLLDEVSAALPLDRDIRALAALARQAENLPRAP